MDKLIPVCSLVLPGTPSMWECLGAMSRRAELSLKASKGSGATLSLSRKSEATKAWLVSSNRMREAPCQGWHYGLFSMPQESSAALAGPGGVCAWPVSKWAVSMKNRPISVLNRCSSSEHIICLLLIFAVDSCNLTWTVPSLAPTPTLQLRPAIWAAIRGWGWGGTVEHLQLPCWFWKSPVMLLRKSGLTMSRHWMVSTLQRTGLLLNRTAPCRISAWERNPHEQTCHLF